MIGTLAILTTFFATISDADEPEAMARFRMLWGLGDVAGAYAALTDGLSPEAISELARAHDAWILASSTIEEMAERVGIFNQIFPGIRPLEGVTHQVSFTPGSLDVFVLAYVHDEWSRKQLADVKRHLKKETREVIDFSDYRERGSWEFECKGILAHTDQKALLETSDYKNYKRFSGVILIDFGTDRKARHRKILENIKEVYEPS